MTSRYARPPVCLGHTQGRDWRQEWFESASGDARRRAAEVRRAGFRAITSSLGYQVTPLGQLKLSLVDIRGRRCSHSTGGK